MIVPVGMTFVAKQVEYFVANGLAADVFLGGMGLRVQTLSANTKVDLLQWGEFGQHQFPVQAPNEFDDLTGSFRRFVNESAANAVAGLDLFDCQNVLAVVFIGCQGQHLGGSEI